MPETKNVIAMMIRFEIELAKVYTITRSLFNQQSRVVVLAVFVDRFENYLFDRHLQIQTTTSIDV